MPISRSRSLPSALAAECSKVHYLRYSTHCTSSLCQMHCNQSSRQLTIELQPTCFSETHPLVRGGDRSLPCHVGGWTRFGQRRSSLHHPTRTTSAEGRNVRQHPVRKCPVYKSRCLLAQHRIQGITSKRHSNLSSDNRHRRQLSGTSFRRCLR